MSEFSQIPFKPVLYSLPAPTQDQTAENDLTPRSNGQNLRERLVKAIYHFQTLAKDRNVLIQIWVPVKRGLKSFLTTAEQPFSYDPSCSALVSFRNVSESYQFSADEDSKEGLGLPGRVFRRRAPEWTPDVRLFRQDEYPRVNYAQMCDVRGSIALPVFEKGSGMCLGVVEIVTTSHKITCRPEVETVCKALEAVDLRSSEIISPSKDKKCGSELQRLELSEILHIIRAICDSHGLPLGQTWTATDKNAHCASTIDAACYVRDQNVLGFHQACSEQQLIGSQGVVGKALMTNQPCYAIDITAHSKSEYPLSHHAKMFRLQGAVAVHLQCLYDPSKSYVLEFFLPTDCQDPCLTLHFRIMESLTKMVKDSHSFCFFLADKEVQHEPALSKKPSHSDTSWISSMVEAQQKGKEVGLSFEFGKESRDEFRVTTHWGEVNVESERGGMFNECGGMNQEFQDSGFMESLGCSSFGSDYSMGARKTGEKRRTKAQKTISLDVLRQYFAGSLKDAARSIGVCPTTLKRICRQHGINRWPSRKIKKVGHSLKKLQLVIDSVQGAQGSIKLSSFYSEFPQLSPTDAKINDQSNPLSALQERTVFSSGGTTSQSNSSSQTSTSSHSFSTGAKASPITPNACASGDTSTSQDQARSLKRARSEAELLVPNHKPPARRDGAACKVKATFGEEMVRLTLTPNMGFEALQREIAKRFGLGDLDKMHIKYLDDDEEWVLLTCDDDLEECIDIQRANGSQNVKLSVHQVTTRLGGSLGSRGQS